MKIVLGTAQLTRAYGITACDDSRSLERRPRQVLECAEQLGCVGIDTSPVYGSAEREIGEAGTRLSLHTKLDSSLTLVDSVKNSLRRLRREHLDIVYFHHRLETPEVGRIDSKVRQVLDSQVVGNLGISVYELSELSALKLSDLITVVQAPFSVLDRRFSEDVFGEFVQSGGQVFVRSIFLQGLLLSRSQRVPLHLDALVPYLSNFWRICVDWDVDPIDGAMQFVFRKLPFAGLVVGARSVGELHRIMKAREAVIAEGYFLALDEMNLPSWDTVDPRKW